MKRKKYKLPWNQFCIGCGRPGVFFCEQCRALNAAVERKVARLRETLSMIFAQR